MKPLLFVFVFISYLSLWSFANWPALKEAWWSTDDFSYIEELRSPTIKSYPGLSNGRPISSLWFATFLLEYDDNREIYNIALRVIQGLIHCLATLFAAVMLWKQIKNWGAFISVLPFLLWPFNGDAVLWRSAGYYPIAALFGLAGLFVLWKSKEKEFLKLSIGAILIIIATLTNQITALSGLIVWFIISSLRILKCKSSISSKRKLIFSTIYLIILYLIGGLLSYFIANYFNPDTRAKFTKNYIEKISYLLNLNDTFIFSPLYYPLWLIGLLTLLFVIYGIVIFKRAIKKELSAKDFLVYFLLPILLLITPYAPLLLVSENLSSPRIMYLSAFLITGIWIVLKQDLGKHYWSNILLYSILTLIIIGYIKIARISSSDYVKMFHYDLLVLEKIEEFAMQEKVDDQKVFVATFPDFIREWNPYKITYIQGDSKLSAFLKSWSAHPFIRLYSSLKTTENENVKDACLSYCENTKNGKNFQLFKIRNGRNSNIICLCP
jgi:hypothetical protein